MRVSRNFEALYRAEADPWAIGDATGPRYDRYVELVLANASARGSLLDIGCGQAGLLSRFEGEFRRLVGVDVSETAVARARLRVPHADFSRGSAGSLGEVARERFDFVLCSDVLYYLPHRARRRAVAEIAERLAPHGRGLIAAWAPGGRYLTREELRQLVRAELRIEHEELLETGHALFVVSPKRVLAAITVDYETWQPIPAGRRIDWERDVFEPATALLDLCDDAGARLTFFAEMGEYWWLDANEPALARRMEAQWRDAVRRGHDVQLHLHPNWLPELGASREGQEWSWNEALAAPAAFPGDLSALIARCVARLQEVLRPVDPQYAVRCFRAGGYRAQPFRRLRLALLANGIDCDSSVYAGGFSAERGYDYRNAFSAHQPYFAAAEDPQLNAPPAEEDLLELPIFTFRPGERWFLDGPEGPRAGQRLRGFLRARLAREHSPEAMRALARVRGVAAALYHVARPLRPLLSRFLPRRLLWQAGSEYPPAPGPAHDYFVMVGHTKADLDLDGIRQTLDVLRLDGVEFLRLSELAALAREELAPQGRPDARAEMEYQVRREYDAVMSDERNLAQSARLQSMIPLDRERVLDLGCGAGDWTRRIARLRPWAHVVGIDAGVPFVTRAAARRAGERSAFAAADFARLPFSSAAFDCVYADTTLEHAFDVDRTLAEAWRVLRDGGVLVATIPSDGRNPARACDNHTWKTVPADVRARLHHAGFVDVCLEEVDILRKLAMPPYAPADDRMMFVRAWKRAAPATQLERAREAMAWVYRRIQPGAPPVLATRAEEFLAAGNALCWGYSVVLGEFLRAEGYTVRWVTMIAEGHPRGRGPRRLDSHEVLEVTADGRRLVLDPTCNTVIPWSVEELLAEPWRATAKADPDDRYLDGQYQLYDSVEWYRRVRRYAVRRDPAQPLWPWSWRRLRALPGPAARAEAGR